MHRLQSCVLLYDVGVSGTVSKMEDYEKEVLQDEYKILGQTIAPSIYAKGNFIFEKKKHVKCTEDRNSFYQALEEAINRVRTAQPCLLFFYSEQAMHNFIDSPYGKRIHGLATLYNKTYNYDFTLSQSTKPGAVTCLPALEGRGNK